MKVPKKEQNYLPPDLQVLPEPEQTEEEKWLESLETVIEFTLKDKGPQKTARFLDSLTDRLRARGVDVPRLVSTPYINTIPADKQPAFPGDREMERRIKSYIRWNAMAMVVNANREHSGSAATSRPTPRRRRFTRLASTISSAGARKISSGTWFISRATPRPAFMPARSWKAAWTNATCRISARNWPRAAGCRPIRILI